MTTTTSAEPTTPTHHWAILALLGVAQLMVVLDATIVNIALPSAQNVAALLDRQPAVGHHRLRAGVRKSAAARRQARRHVRPEMDVHRRADRFRHGLRDRRDGAVVRDARRRSRPAGRVRCAARPLSAWVADRDLPGLRRPPEGVRHLQRDRRRGRLTRVAARRRDHAGDLLALVHVRQPRDRGADSDHGAAPAEPSAPLQPRADRPAGSPRLVGRPVRARVRLLPRGDDVVVEPGHDRRARAQRRAAAQLPRDRAPRRASSAAASDRVGQGSRRRLRIDRAGGLGRVRGVPVPDLLHAAEPRLLAADNRAGVPADERHDRHHGDNGADEGASRGRAPSRS